MSHTRQDLDERGPALVKVVFQLAADASHGFATETLWAERLSPQTCRLANVPFYAYGVSYDDVVRVSGAGGLCAFVGVAARGCHSTYRLLLARDYDEAEFGPHWSPLERLGCTYEVGTKRLLAVDVPPAADIYEVYALLEEKEAEGFWGFEEGHCGHPLKS